METQKTNNYDLTGLPCKSCGIILNNSTHSNRSKLTPEYRKKRRPWRICKTCLTKQKARTRNRKKDRAYSKEYKVLNWEKTLIQGCKKRAKEFNLTFDLKEKDLTDLFKKQKGRCFWFGVKLNYISQKKYLFKTSVDRIDNSRGYTKNNIILCSYFANIGRSDASFSEWQASSKKIIKSLKFKSNEKRSFKL